MNSNFFDKARANMVNNQLLPNGVKDLDLIESFDNTKKELFVPDSEKEVVYSDSDILISPDRYLARTFVLAKMFEYCSFSKDDSVLVIGCLTGYSVAIISNLVSSSEDGLTIIGWIIPLSLIEFVNSSKLNSSNFFLG